MLPAVLKTIGASAFTACTAITNVTIPAAVTTIGDSAFRSCNQLFSACFLWNAPLSVGTTIFDFAASGFKIYYFYNKAFFSTPTWLGYPSVRMGSSSAPAAASPWLLENGFAYNQNMTSDPDGDGVSLLMAYALNLDPNQNLSGSQPNVVLAGNQMSFTFYAGSQGITYSVESCVDMKNWSTAGVVLSAPDANNFRTATVNASDPGRFMRLVAVY